jgi:V/A-type H+-transporting ATPase subunit F
VRKIVVIAPPDVRSGFALAGVRQLSASPEELPVLLQRLVRDPLHGAIIVDERLVTGGARAFIRELDRRWTGLVIVLPAPERAGAVADEDYVLQLIRRAIGYQVRLSL